MIYNNNTLEIGSEVNEFTIQEVLGEGNFSKTYLAYDNDADKQVLMKEYFPNYSVVRDITSYIVKTT